MKPAAPPEVPHPDKCPTCGWWINRHQGHSGGYRFCSKDCPQNNAWAGIVETKPAAAPRVTDGLRDADLSPEQRRRMQGIRSMMAVGSSVGLENQQWLLASYDATNEWRLKLLRAWERICAALGVSPDTYTDDIVAAVSRRPSTDSLRAARLEEREAVERLTCERNAATGMRWVLAVALDAIAITSTNDAARIKAYARRVLDENGIDLTGDAAGDHASPPGKTGEGGR